jgi:phosphoglycolate phosphatase
MKMSPRPIIFDLDGTLVDSAPLCAAIINEMLAERGSTRVVAALDARRFLTKGGIQLVTALLGSEAHEAQAEVVEFRARYASRPTPQDCLFPGVAEGLDALSQLGVSMAICSNKPKQLCEKIVAELGIASHFAVVAGSVPDLPLKPAADLAHRALAGLGAPAADCLFLGDSEVDLLTAAAAGVPFAFVTYGYAEPGFTAGDFPHFDEFAEFVRFASPPLSQVA